MSDQRDYWPRGLVRHLRVSEDADPDNLTVIRANEGMDICYTLVVHPKYRERVEEFRSMMERCSALGGPFSPERDL